MRDFKRRYKKLYKLYRSELLKLSLQDPLEYFVTSLKLTRDYRLLNCPPPQSEDEKVSLAALITAVAEYELYKGYSDVPPSKELDLEKEKNYHWSKFWQLVALNIEDWNKINA